MRRLLLLAPFGLALLPGQPLGPSPALAQFSGPPPQAGQGTRPPPPALPGLAARRAPEPIPGDPNANLAPTAALFDAINRGDLAAARDAVARGARLEERNVLGLTPIDAAVDQGRNDILFYLLSTRGTALITQATKEEPEPFLYAHDAKTGAVLAEVKLPGGVFGGIMTYRAGGKQFVVAPIGGAGLPAELVAVQVD